VEYLQERLWKRAAAAQYCRWIAELKGQTDFRVTDIQQRQQKVAHIIANFVKEFWRTVELTIVREKDQGSAAVNSPRKVSPVNGKGEAIPMDSDGPAVGEVIFRS
jgi:hypothetical protein